MLDWWLPPNVSTFGQEIDWLFHLIYYITGVTFVLVFVTMLAFVIIYRDRPGRTARYTHGSTPLEIAWTVVPALILVILTMLSVPAWSRINMHVPPADFDVNVTAKQFNWQVNYPGSDTVFLDEMHVPVNKVIRVHLRELVRWFEVMKPGRYEWPCAELCGFGHSGMRGWIYVHTPAEYAKWAAENLRAGAKPAAAPPEAEPKKEEKPKK